MWQTSNNEQKMKQRKIRGMTTIEAVIAVTIMSFVIFGSILALLATLTAWTKGQTRMANEIKSEQALRWVVGELREAMNVTVDGNGLGLTYHLPTTDGGGSYVVPVTSDGVDRRIFLDNANNLVANDGVSDTILVRGLITTDPRNANVSYRIFTAGAGVNVRQVTVKIITRGAMRNSQYAYGRVRETVVLRNLPTTS